MAWIFWRMLHTYNNISHYRHHNLQLQVARGMYIVQEQDTYIYAIWNSVKFVHTYIIVQYTCTYQFVKEYQFLDSFV